MKVISRQLAEAKADLVKYRTRATQAEQEAADWRKRFDKLLDSVRESALPKITGTIPKVSVGSLDALLRSPDNG